MDASAIRQHPRPRGEACRDPRYIHEVVVVRVAGENRRDIGEVGHTERAEAVRDRDVRVDRLGFQRLRALLDDGSEA